MSATYTGSDKRLQYLFEHGGGGGGGADIWVGTLAEYTQQAAQIADGTTVLITDDEDNYITEYHVYSTTEHVIGQWIDGSTIYERTVVNSGSDITLNSGAWTTICSESWCANISKIINGNLTRQASPAVICPIEFIARNNVIQVNPFRDTTFKSNAYFTVQYTKTS